MVNIECFYVTSRRPYWCPKTMNRRPCWCPKPILWELNSFLMQTLSFVPINLHRCWPREWKHSIGKTTATNQWGQRILDRPGSQKSPVSNFKKEQWTDPYGRASKRKNTKKENKNKMVDQFTTVATATEASSIKWFAFFQNYMSIIPTRSICQK